VFRPLCSSESYKLYFHLRVRVECRVTSCDIRGGLSADEVDFSPGIFKLSLAIISSQLLHTCRRLSSPVRQYIITYSVCKLVASSLVPHLSGYSVNKFDLGTA
jgi:hypothetical protein